MREPITIQLHTKVIKQLKQRAAHFGETPEHHAAYLISAGFLRHEVETLAFVPTEVGSPKRTLAQLRAGAAYGLPADMFQPDGSPFSACPLSTDLRVRAETLNQLLGIQARLRMLCDAMAAMPEQTAALLKVLDELLTKPGAI